uniref:Uncharacterized protein n=1 Tax=virus sp. ctML55 TaxID=2827627 RepID=A0A8S5RIG0_9VIRU|nr:MAG TPA: hypothetical protein [virus sp. ctML55]DAW91975.1 MAG TPA: hypothetical protein [Bacteriophage sp.]
MKTSFSILLDTVNCLHSYKLLLQSLHLCSNHFENL